VPVIQTSGPARRPAGIDLAIYGSDTIGEDLMPEFIREYYRIFYDTSVDRPPTPEECKISKAPDIKYNDRLNRLTVFLSRMGTETGFQHLISEDNADIAMASDPADAYWVRKARENGKGDLHGESQEHVIGLDGVVVLVNRENSISKLSIVQIKDIFCGRINNWKMVGGADLPIKRYYRNGNSGTFKWTSEKKIDCPMVGLEPENRFASNGVLRDRVGADKGGIGFVSFAYSEAVRKVNENTKPANVKPLNIGTECGLVFAPTYDSIRSEEYPWTRKLFLHNARSSPHIAEINNFIKFILAPRLGQEVLENNGFVSVTQRKFDGPPGRDWSAIAREANPDLRPILKSLAVTGARMRTTIRFASDSADVDQRTDSADFDPLARQDIKSLKDFLVENHSATGDKVAIVGFTDAPRRNSKVLSERHARRVFDELKGVPEMTYFGLGDKAPVTCNDTEDGKSANRRVEIWVYH
jgi:phosphate transport system substrate-binding protein